MVLKLKQFSVERFDTINLAAVVVGKISFKPAISSIFKILFLLNRCIYELISWIFDKSNFLIVYDTFFLNTLHSRGAHKPIQSYANPRLSNKKTANKKIKNQKTKIWIGLVFCSLSGIYPIQIDSIYIKLDRPHLKYVVSLLPTFEIWVLFSYHKNFPNTFLNLITNLLKYSYKTTTNLNALMKYAEGNIIF